MTRIIKQIDIEEVKDEYKPVFDIFTNEDEKVYRLKWIIANVLDETERRIILIYTDCQSQRKVAQMLGISTSLANIKINQIRKKIKEEL